MKSICLTADKLVGKRITHYIFGRGKVTRAQEHYIFADFHGVERMFEFPAAFGTYLTVEDKRLQTVLPVCTRTPQPAAPARPRRLSALHDEYDTAALAETVHCTV